MPLLPTTITLSIQGGETKPLGVNDTPAVFPQTNPLLFEQVTLNSGTGSANAQKIGMVSYGMTGQGRLVLDLAAADGPFGDVDFTKVKELVIDNQSDNQDDIVTVGDDGTTANAWTTPFAGTNARLKCHPGAPTRIPAPLGGMAVSAGNRNLLLVNTNTGTNVASGNVILIGEGT